MNTGEKLKTILDFYDGTNSEFAKRIGVSNSTLSAMKTGIRKIDNIPIIKNIGKVFNLDLHDTLDLLDERNDKLNTRNKIFLFLINQNNEQNM